MKNLDIIYKINFYLNNNKNNKKILEDIDIKLNSIIIETDESIVQYDISNNPIIYKNIRNIASLSNIDKLI